MFQDILNKIAEFFGGGQESAPPSPLTGKSKEELDAGFEQKGLIKLTDPETGKETWSTPESAKQMYSQGWSGSVQGQEDSAPIQRNTPSVPSQVPTVTPTPDRAGQPFAEMINKATAQYGLPEHVLYELLRKESMTFNPNVVSGNINSNKGAQGIAQFMPATAQSMGIDPLNPEQAIPGAADYLSQQMNSFGDMEKALAAYNAGPGNVRKYGGIPPFPETQNYVRDVMGRSGLR